MNSVHIRRKALPRGPRQTRDTYGPFDGDPQRLTLCGARATTQDLAWAETRSPRGPGFNAVTCSDCRTRRHAEVSA